MTLLATHHTTATHHDVACTVHIIINSSSRIMVLYTHFSDREEFATLAILMLMIILLVQLQGKIGIIRLQ